MTGRTAHSVKIAAGLVVAVCCIVSCSKNRDAEEIQFKQLTYRDGYLVAGRFSEKSDQIFYAASWDGNPIKTFEAYPSGFFGVAAESDSVGGQTSRLPTWLARGAAFTLSGDLRGFGQMGFVEPGDILRPPSSGTGEEWSDESRVGGRRVVVRRVDDEDWLESPPGRVLFRTPGWISDPRYSPDGQSIAFLSHQGFTDSQGTVVTIEPRDTPSILPGLCTTIGGLAWSPSGKEVWFTASCDTPGQALYAMTVKGKKRQLVSSAGSLRLLDISQSGRVLLARDSVRYALTILGPKSSDEVDLPWQPSARNLQMSSDGEILAYDLPNPVTGPSVFVRRHRNNWKPDRVARGALLDLSADGHRLLVKGDRINPVSLFCIDIDDGSRTDVSTDGFQYISGGFLAGTDRIHFLASDRSGPFRVYAQKMGKNPPEAISPGSATDRGCPSPDGNFVIGRGPDRQNYLYSVSGREPRRIPGLEGLATPLRWTADGQGLYVTKPTEVPARIWRMSVRDGKKVLWKIIEPANRVGLVVAKSIRISADARTVAFTYLRTTSDLFIADGIR